jgi:transcriptional regulator with XRE-family HTH domain
MNNSFKDFGDFIAKKREEKKITLREMAKLLDISPPYLSDVEKDRRNPFDLEKLELLTNILILSEDDKTIMLDLAGKKRNEVAPDLPEYIMDRDYVSAALRTARDLDAGEEDWLKFVEELKRRKG